MIHTTNEPNFWDRRARKYAASAIADQAGYERTLARTRERLGPDRRVLEIGCGTGTTALALAPATRELVATDFSFEMIAIAREKAEAARLESLRFEVATPDGAAWPDESFDAVLAFNVLHLVRARRACLESVHRLLVPGGEFISKTPCLGDMNPAFRALLPAMQLVRMAPHVDFLTAEALEREFDEAGFEVVEREYHASRGRDARPYLVAKKR